MILSDLQCYDPKYINGYLVPCGKCYACKLKRSNDWSIRLHEEYTNFNGKAIFVTLTYQDDKLNIAYNNEDEPFAFLCKRDIQLFHKRLRHKVRSFNYFLIGEYGPTTLRPHYHAIYFGLDMSCYDDLLSCWDKGFITVSLVTDGRIGYVVKYSLLPQSLPEYLTAPVYKPFMLSSKGMGVSFLQNPQTIRMYNDENRLYYNDNGFKKSLPRYYRNKIFSKDKQYMFAQDYKRRVQQFAEDSLRLQKEFPEEYDKMLKNKKDWVSDHKRFVEQKLLKKSKL